MRFHLRNYKCTGYNVIIGHTYTPKGEEESAKLANTYLNITQSCLHQFVLREIAFESSVFSIVLRVKTVQ